MDGSRAWFTISLTATRLITFGKCRSRARYPLDQITVYERSAGLKLLLQSTIFGIEGLGYSLGIQITLSNFTGQ
jgi:hypothetical protein